MKEDESDLDSGNEFDDEFEATDDDFSGRQSAVDEDVGDSLRDANGKLRPNWREIVAKQDAARRRKEAKPEAPLPSSDLIELSALPGNYLFAVGLPGSGKTVLQSHLLHYLFSAGKYTTEVDPTEQNRFQHLETLRHWQTCWEDGLFPESTQVDRADHFRYTVRTTDQEEINRPFKFGFVEVSGEHLRRVEGQSDQRPQLPDALHSLLANRKCKLVFILVCNGAKDVERSDRFFRAFIEYFNYHPELKFRKSTPMVFVVSDPDAAELTLEGWREKMHDQAHEEAPSRFRVQTLLRDMLPQTFGGLSGWKGPKVSTGFRVGKIEWDAGIKRERIASYEYEDASRLFGWIYRKLTTFRLGDLFGVSIQDDW